MELLTVEEFHLVVKGVNLLFNGSLPKDSIWHDNFHGIFFEAQTHLVRAFKVDNPPFIRVWEFDRNVAMEVKADLPKSFRAKSDSGEVLEDDQSIVEEIQSMGSLFQDPHFRPALGKFYTTDILRREPSQEIVEQLESYGWLVRVEMCSFQKLEYLVLVIFSPEGAILEADTNANLLVIDAEESLITHGGQEHAEDLDMARELVHV